MNASVFDQSAHLTKWSMSRIQTHLGYVHMVLNIFSTCRKFQPDILFPWNHVKVSFCSDGTDNRMNFGTCLAKCFLTQCKITFRKRKVNLHGSTENEHFTWTDEETAILLNVASSYKNE